MNYRYITVQFKKQTFKSPFLLNEFFKGPEILSRVSASEENSARAHVPKGPSLQRGADFFVV